MLIVHGTGRFLELVPAVEPVRFGTAPSALGDWYATALPGRPQVALLVNARTFVPVLTKLAPALGLLERLPDAIAHILRLHGVDDRVVRAERAAMAPVRLVPTVDLRVLRLMHWLAAVSKELQATTSGDLDDLSLRLGGLLVGSLGSGAGQPSQALAAALGGSDDAAGGLRRAGPDLLSRTPLPDPAATVVADGRGDAKDAVDATDAADATVGAADPAERAVYQLKVTLRGTKPPIWRRILVAGTSTLDELHLVVQAAFGWWNEHLHGFVIDGTGFAVPVEGAPDWAAPVIDERRVRLIDVAFPGSELVYRYDLGDDWEHRIVVEKVLPADPALQLPACVAGRRAGPPEDCGGVFGYHLLLAALADPHHPDHAERRAWLGGPFDPDAFDPREFEPHLSALRRATQEQGPGAPGH